MIFSSHATTARWEVVHIDRGFQQSQKCKSHYTNEDCKIPRFSKYKYFLQQIFTANIFGISTKCTYSGECRQHQTF